MQDFLEELFVNLLGKLIEDFLGEPLKKNGGAPEEISEQPQKNFV